jgi:PAS domain S-box-containing protein
MVADVLVERVLERMSDAFVCLDREGRYVYVNQRAGEILGREPVSLIGKQIWTVLPMGAGLLLRRAYERAVAENRPVQLEVFDAASGKWIESRIHPDLDGLAIFFSDVTGRHAAEEELRKVSAAREQAERMAHLGFWEWDVAANRVEWSDELYRIYGLTRKEFGASFEGYLERIHPEDRVRVRATVEQALRERCSFTFEERIVRPDGSVRYLHSWGTVSVGAGGEPKAMFGTCLDMTQLIETTEGLARSERWLELALEAARVVVWDWNLRTGDVAWSRGADELLGASPSARTTLLSFVREEDRAHVADVVERAIADGASFAVEFRARRADGSVRWLSGRGRVVRDATGKAARVAGSLVDCTERKRTELLLAGESVVLERISANAPLAESLDLLARTMDAQAPGNLSSIVLLDADGKRIRHAAGPNLPDAYNRLVDGLAIGPGAGSCGTAAFRREKVFVSDIATDPLWAEYSHLALEHGLRACWSTPIFGADGALLGTFAIYRREPSLPGPPDLQIIARATHVARIAIESERARDALRRSNERFDLVIRGTDTGIWDRDFATEELFLSRRWKSQLGYAEDELPSRPGLWESLLHPEDRERALGAVRDYLEGRTTTFELEHRLRHKDGSYRWIVARGIAIRDAAGRPLRMAGSHEDVTERKALQAQVLQAQKMETVGRLASGVAHDFNNVLSVIMSCSEIIRARLAPADPLGELVEEIRKTCHQASSLTRQLLIFAREQAARPERLDLNAVVTGMENMLRRLIHGGTKLELDLGRPLGLIKADAGRVEQVVLNLCLNARDAMPRGGTIVLSTAAAEVATAADGLRGRVDPGSYVRLAVRDEGTGMPPETVARLFEPFFTTKEPGKGTGLGLSTVDTIVRAAGGSIVIESEVGKGSTFAVYFPRVHPADAAT